ncbi:hypothetical protein PM082_010836 [Marasmius tenuissimus]|nr:hypothetical protein PM082_010836 [Marasmius tenuissimus]
MGTNDEDCNRRDIFCETPPPFLLPYQLSLSLSLDDLATYSPSQIHLSVKREGTDDRRTLRCFFSVY